MKTVLWIVVIAVVAVGGYTLYAHRDISLDDQDASDEQVVPAPEEKPAGKKMPFSDFIKLDKGSYQCTVHSFITDVDNTGTVYLDKGKIRGNISTVAEGKTMKISFIMDGAYQYVWTMGSPNGYKVKVSDAPGVQNVYQWSAEQVGEYDCQPWTVDASVFALPAEVTFSEASAAQVQQYQNGGR